MNITVISGRVAGDCQVRTGKASGKPFCSTKLYGAKQSAKDGAEPESWTVNLTAFGSHATTLASAAATDAPVLVQGRLKTERWLQDGQERTKLVLLVEHAVVLPQAATAPPAPTPAPAPARAATATAATGDLDEPPF